MQRWIALGVVAMVVLMGGGALGLYLYKQNRPTPIWVPLPINPQLPAIQRDELVRDLKAKLSDTQLLTAVSRDTGLKQIWDLTSDEEGAHQIGKRLFVEVGEMATPTGTGPSINIGVRGKRKERAELGKIAMRLTQEVWSILGIKPPPQP